MNIAETARRAEREAPKPKELDKWNWVAVKVYLAGPMRGIPQFNKPAFDEAAEFLRSAGFEVWSPSENDAKKFGSDVFDDPTCQEDLAFRRQVFLDDTAEICRNSDQIVVLPGWETSKGVIAEIALANALGLPVFYYDPKAEPAARLRNKPFNAVPRPDAPGLFPADAKGRKTYPVFTGVLKYFPDAIAAVAHVSWVGNNQHNPGQPLHWARGKSNDQEDTALRHMMEAGTFDTDGVRHSAKHAWRALAILQLEIERDRGIKPV